ncbi:hypothetical protein SFRURICE_003305 [Spodoptera frugiperda]|nr:hypothetical protein SFRURICE_003305 [Spodoptera frugiperda]
MYQRIKSVSRSKNLPSVLMASVVSITLPKMGYIDFHHAWIESSKLGAKCDFSDFCYIVFISAKLSKGWLLRPVSVTGMMEHALVHRERVGVQDFVLLEDFRSEAAFIDNLKKRFNENIIYTYIGNVLISVNPYKNLPIYTEEKTKLYYKKAFFEAPPHVFAIADNAYRSLVYEHREQCILISGESGSGKTEASKKVLEYIAARTNHLRNVETVKDKLLQTNPLLEAFGNAKTHRNDNSRNQRNQDAEQFRTVQEAMKVIEINQTEQTEIFEIVASVLHLGNAKFVQNDKGYAEILSHDANSNNVAELLKVDSTKLKEVLTSRTISARGDVVNTPLDLEQAQYARDALAKAIYDKHFSWLVSRLNASLAPKDKDSQSSVIGILDIYGFEIFPKNSFEQFCINFCNEKLQQLFIQLTLKQEQEEYLREGIEWEPVEYFNNIEQEEYRREGIEWEPVEYFNNIVICDLIEARHTGIIAILDDECLRPGDATDLSLLEKLTQNLEPHPHYKSHRRSDIKTQKIMGRDEFCLVHYAGEVTYNVSTFLEKNNDLLFRDIQSLMATSGNTIVATCFKDINLTSKKRPETAITQFKNSLNELIKILSSKEPSYIRCIKPNDFKAPMQFDDKLVSHQVKYLGLMENLRVRRAGFAYRRTYEAFLERYKCLSRDTWPNFRGAPRDGVQKLVEVLNFEKEDYRMGNTKIFIRFPKTLFETEDAYQIKKNDIATIIQSRWRGYWQRKQYLKMREAAIVIQKWVRRFLAQRLLARRKKAAMVIRAFIKGFITRNGPETPENRRFLGIAKVHWLKRLASQLPTKVLDLSWPPCPATCQAASRELHRLHRAHLARKYRLALSSQDKKQFELKVLAEKMFKGKKNSYQASVGERFQDDRLTSEHQTLRNTFMASPSWPTGEQLIRSNNRISIHYPLVFAISMTHQNFFPQYSCEAVKYDRRGYKPRERALLASDKALYVLDAAGRKTYKLKHRLPLDKLRVVVTNETDTLVLIKIPQELKKDKGDLIISVSHLIEALTIVTDYTKKPELIEIVDTRTIAHNFVNGKQGGTIEVQNGPQANIHRAKSGNLLVIATP